MVQETKAQTAELVAQVEWAAAAVVAVLLELMAAQVVTARQIILRLELQHQLDKTFQALIGMPAAAGAGQGNLVQMLAVTAAVEPVDLRQLVSQDQQTLVVAPVVAHVMKIPEHNTQVLQVEAV